MILLRPGKLKLKMVRELGIDNIKKASPQKRQFHKYIQLTFMIKGTLSWTVPGGKTIRLHGGEYCITRHGNTFDILYDVLSPCSLMWIIFNPFSEGAEKGTCFSKKELLEMGNNLVDSSMSVYRMSHAMHFYINEMRDLAMKSDGRKISSADMHRIRIGLMGVFIESASRLPCKSSSTEELCRQIKELVLAEPAKNLSIEDIAGFFHLSPGFFGKRFRAESGISAADFVRRVKLEESVRLMREESKNITETAFALGFSSSQYFATLFKKYFGRTPREFRTLLSTPFHHNCLPANFRI